MTATAKELLAAALSLPEDDRRRLAQRLLESVPRESEDRLADAWDDEVLDRIQAVERREVEAHDWDQTASELRAKYRRK